MKDSNFEMSEAGTVYSGEGGTHEKSIINATQYTGDVETARELIEAGADVNEVDGGRTPLSSAVARGHIELAQFLLEQGAGPNFKGGDGYYILHKAVAKEDVRLVRLLLENGADPNVRDKSGQQPLDTAIRYNCDDIVKLLRGESSPVTKKDTASESGSVSEKSGLVVTDIQDMKALVGFDSITLSFEGVATGDRLKKGDRFRIERTGQTGQVSEVTNGEDIGLAAHHFALMTKDIGLGEVKAGDRIYSL